ncbi:hypothetical protein FISHEDRAFT_67157 [Fistulina hepatica ATCC 64428]|uniref:BZIP domain-containing protein n=1 Tax=Fistulina hepatica ATCC 64428 TaxID=1128425 RepID=A0A0D7A571_9AGAR|nr:hypothetical protein FISHEDRAFT_67157 [Fistulina hepatica ATCC 64428]
MEEHPTRKKTCYALADTVSADMFSEIFNVDLFTSISSASPTATAHSSSGQESAMNSASRESSPQSPFASLLTTPPQPVMPTSFPEIASSEPYGSFLGFMGEDNFGSSSSKGMLWSAGYGSAGMPSFEALSMSPSIDPQLVGTPSTSQDDDGGQADDEREEMSQPVTEQTPPAPPQREKLTVTINPVKVGGQGRGKRRGTVQSGGIVKATARAASISMPAPPSPTIVKNKENTTTKTETDSDDPSAFMGEEDWRPSPEVLAKMSSKEKRQLRNKISARNFRVRRKEYITTLEMDIAERDRLLGAIRSELGSTQSENFALRQEISALKKALLEGRGGAGMDVLVPPAPLSLTPDTASVTLKSDPAKSALSSSSGALVTPNTHKDVNPSSLTGSFWGGLTPGGVTPVHTVLLPPTSFGPFSPSPFTTSPFISSSDTSDEEDEELSKPAIKALQENINPALNVPSSLNTGLQPHLGLHGFEGFADSQMFSMKTMDSYRMHLWTKMAAHHSAHSQSKLPPYRSVSSASSLTGHAQNLRPAFFTSVPTKTPTGSVVAPFVSGKYSSPPPPYTPSPYRSKEGVTASKDIKPSSAKEVFTRKETLVGKLSSVFWDAFSGSSSGGASSSSGVRVVDTDKAVLREVVKEKPPTKDCHRHMTDILEESMRSLSLGRH